MGANMPTRLLAPSILLACLCAHNASAAERATAAGRVLDAAGKPIEHATVLVYEAHVRRGFSIYCPTCWVDCGKRAQTDSSGHFSIGNLDPDLVFKLLIVSKDYQAAFVDKVDPAKGPAPDANLKPRVPISDASQTVRGRVLDDHGKPVRDAVVEQSGVTYNGPRGLGTMFGPNDSPDWIEPLAATDDQGEFEIAYAHPAVSIILNVTPRAMAPKLVKLSTGSDRKTVTVTEGATVFGRVLLPDGKPAANIEIAVMTHSRISGQTYAEVRIGTKDDGTFAITNIPPGRIWDAYPRMESLADRGFAGETVSFETKDDAEEIGLGEIKLEKAFTLRGTVVPSDGSAVPPDMHVTISSGFNSQIVPLNQDGTFEVKGLLKGVYGISPGVRGYKPADNFYGEVLVNRDGKNITIPIVRNTPK
jgi:uncharacterized GH25 family protein